MVVLEFPFLLFYCRWERALDRMFAQEEEEEAKQREKPMDLQHWNFRCGICDG